MTSIVYSPEDYGAELLFEWEAYEPNWSFDTLLFLRGIEDGKLYVGTDSGCSCPLPFEDHKFPTDFTEVRTWREVKAVIDNEFPHDGTYRNRLPFDALRRRVQHEVAR